MAGTPSDVLTVHSESQDLLIKYMEACYQVRDEGWQLRNRLEDVDRSYMREKDYTEEQRKAQAANKNGDPTKLQNPTIPIVMESVESSVGFLTNVFLTDYPMFKFVTNPQAEKLALMWNTLVGEDQIYFKWAGQFNIAFRNGAKYNFAPIEVDWCKYRKYKPSNSAQGKGVALEQIIYEGNKIKAIDPYNLVYDPRVPIHEVHTRGEFIGYIEQMSRIELKNFLFSLGDERLKNDVKAFQGGDWGCQYYIPQINPSVILRNRNWNDGAFDWTKWAFGGAQQHINYRNMNTVFVLYARLMPFEFKIHAPKDQTPDIWKLIAVNGVMVWAQPMPNAHDILPIIIAQPKVDNLSHQTKSQAENQIPFQDIVTSLSNARLSAARRRVVDRMLYNPLLVDPDHINSPNASAKIPIRPTAYGRKLDEAVYVFPFEDRESGQYIADAQTMSSWSLRMDGRNNTSMGQYQKGNKLQDEFHETMANAGIQDRTQALMWEAFAMTDIKTVMKENYLQFTPKGDRYNRQEKEVVQIDPVQLRQTASEFAVGDGLLPVQRLARTDVMQNFMGWLQNDPQLRGRYDLAPLATYIMQVQGVDKLDQFEKPAEQVQFEQQLQTWQNTAIEYAKLVGKPKEASGIVFTPEDIQKVIGPMPQPPKTPQQQSQQGKQSGNAKSY